MSIRQQRRDPKRRLDLISLAAKEDADTSGEEARREQGVGREGPD